MRGAPTHGTVDINNLEAFVTPFEFGVLLNVGFTAPLRWHFLSLDMALVSHSQGFDSDPFGQSPHMLITESPLDSLR